MISTFASTSSRSSSPPLRERRKEIPGLVNYFLERSSKQFNRRGFAVSPKLMDRFLQHSYPGNIRELENALKRMIVLNDPLLSTALPLSVQVAGDGNGGGRPGAAHSLPLKEIARRAAQMAEREAITATLAQTGWNRVRAARLLQISYRALLYKIKDNGLVMEKAASRW